MWHTALRSLPSRPFAGSESARWCSALALTTLIAGAIVEGAAVGFSPGVAAAVAFGISIVVCAAGFAMAALGWWRRRLKFELGGLAIGALSTWTIVATAGTFADAAARWIAFGSAVGYMLLGVAVLVAYEVGVERVVYLLEVRELPRGTRA